MSDRETRLSELIKTARMGRKYTVTGNRFARVEWPDDYFIDVKVRGRRLGKYGEAHQPNAWGDRHGVEETRAKVIKIIAAEIRMERERKAQRMAAQREAATHGPDLSRLV